MESDAVLFDNAEVEPFVAVNPVNSHLIGVFQHGLISDKGIHGGDALNRCVQVFE